MLKIRQEVSADHSAVNAVVEKAFLGAEHTDGKEHLLVAKLRHSAGFVPELSLVAELSGDIVGHILLTKVQIRSKAGPVESLALAPVSVLPEHQGQGIGAKLITRSHELATDLGFEHIILLGHPEYYPRFGYTPASKWGITAPFPAPDEAFMALELKPGTLVSGKVEYPPEFL